jgi:hypothetical protein
MSSSMNEDTASNSNTESGAATNANTGAGAGAGVASTTSSSSTETGEKKKIFEIKRWNAVSNITNSFSDVNLQQSDMQFELVFAEKYFMSVLISHSFFLHIRYTLLCLTGLSLVMGFSH